MPRTSAGPRTSDGIDTLITVVRAALRACEERDLDTLHSSTLPGTALLSLSALARTVTGLLGGRAGTSLVDGPGVVVVRDLVMAKQELDATARTASAEARQAAELDPLLLSLGDRALGFLAVVMGPAVLTAAAGATATADGIATAEVAEIR